MLSWLMLVEIHFALKKNLGESARRFNREVLVGAAQHGGADTRDVLELQHFLMGGVAVAVLKGNADIVVHALRRRGISN